MIRELVIRSKKLKYGISKMLVQHIGSSRI